VSETVLVTGGFGLVGQETVKRLAADGRRVVATDLGTSANRKAAESRPDGVEACWADLTDSNEVDRLISKASPAAIIHLAAVIPPPIYRNAKLARKVNVQATVALVRAAETLPNPTRFIQASSNAVYGARNPHRATTVLRPDTPPRPFDLYGGHKLEAEEHVRSSSLEWIVLRLGAVLSAHATTQVDLDGVIFGSLLPTDGRVHTVDVRDVASAFAAATTADVAREILLVGGDESHHVRQGDVGNALAAAAGLVGAVPNGRPGNPDSDLDWFVTDWMDTGRAQQALSFQHYSWPDMLAEMSSHMGWKRYPLRLAAPLVHTILNHRVPYRNWPGQYADPWGVIRARWGEPGLDTKAS
jgi:nucleoside-diphosphate-sugar epimerase